MGRGDSSTADQILFGAKGLSLQRSRPPGHHICSVRLESLPDSRQKRIDAIKAIRAATKASLREAHRMTSAAALPAIVGDDLDSWTAYELSEQLRKCGAGVELIDKGPSPLAKVRLISRQDATMVMTSIQLIRLLPGTTREDVQQIHERLKAGEAVESEPVSLQIATGVVAALTDIGCTAEVIRIEQPDQG